MAYRRKTTNSRAAVRSRRTVSRVRRSTTTRRSGPVRRKPAAGKRNSKSPVVKLVIEHRNESPVSRPELTGLTATRAIKRAKF